MSHEPVPPLKHPDKITLQKHRKRVTIHIVNKFHIGFQQEHSLGGVLFYFKAERREAMLVKVISPTEIEAILSHQEFAQWDIKQNDLKEGTPKVMSLIQEIETKASEIYGFHFSDGVKQISFHLLPEYIKIAIEECELKWERMKRLLTGSDAEPELEDTEPEQEELMPTRKNVTVLRFDSLDSLFALSSAFHFTGNSSLYGGRDTGYYLILEHAKEGERYSPSVMEYLVTKENVSPEYVKEHLSILIREHVFETLKNIV